MQINEQIISRPSTIREGGPHRGLTAIRAGYSKGTADKQGPRLLSNAEVKAAIDAAKIERSERTEIDAARVLKEIAAMAFYDPADLIGIARELAGSEKCRQGEGVIEMGGKRYAVSGITSPAHIAGLSENVRRAIVGWSWDRNENLTLKLADKSKALDQLARHLSLYNDRLEVSAVEGLSERIARAKDRANAHDRLAAPATAAALPAQPAMPAANVAPASEASPTGLPGPAAPSPPAPPPKQYQSIMPRAPEPAPWPQFGGFAATDYDPTT
ncbi:terminase small subunit [Bradyrhizobium sp. BWA-3-5]|uniref:terminase small subunit n=1 Tax=Bradyrhizobium sp. BWA-3-5 TaxID=3080013 RepID=UPI00293EFCEF|nr:terminase small subunit [Bradyrhizobium sp. BWA-3-5]WOH68658.1 terminase small subunit [Bradyrhizobium sp. BWA-3-5]